jgi:hypothetical protein
MPRGHRHTEEGENWSVSFRQREADVRNLLSSITSGKLEKKFQELLVLRLLDLALIVFFLELVQLSVRSSKHKETMIKPATNGTNSSLF